MTTIKHAVFVVIAVLLLGLSLTLGGGLFLSQTVRADPGVLYAAPTALGTGAAGLARASG